MATIRCREQCFESIQAVLFDKDGTLAQVEGYLRLLGEARSHALLTKEPSLTTQRTALPTKPPLMEAFGIGEGQLNPTGLLAVGSRQENEVAAAAYLAEAGWSWIAALEAAQDAFAQAEATLSPKVEKTPLVEGTAELLDRLTANTIQIGIVSADLHREVAAFIEHYALHEVDWFCGASSDYLAKTHPDFLTFACESMSVAPQQTLVIGDSASDLLLASRGAAGFLAMVGGWHSPPMIKPIKDVKMTQFWHLAEVEVFV